MTDRPSLLHTVLTYAGRGWPVFPLSPNGKTPHPGLPDRPAGQGGVYWATTDLDQVTTWWDQWPDANIGIATGTPNGVWIMDPDEKHGKGGCADLQALEQQHGALPPTPIVHTATKGRHYYFANDARTAAKVSGKLYGHDSIDTLGTGRYAAGSFACDLNSSIREATGRTG